MAELKENQIFIARVKGNGSQSCRSSQTDSDGSASSADSCSYCNDVGIFGGKLVTVIGSIKNEFFSDENSVDRIFATLDLIFKDNPSKVRFLVSGGFLALNGCTDKNYLDIFESNGFGGVFEKLKEDKLFDACDSEADKWIKERNDKIFSVFSEKYPKQFEIVPTKNFHSDDYKDDFNWACGVLGGVLNKEGNNYTEFMNLVEKDAQSFELRDMRRRLNDKLGDKKYGEKKLQNNIKRHREECKKQNLIDNNNINTLIANYRLTVIIESLYHLIELKNKTGSFVYPNKEMAVYKWLRENFKAIASDVENYDAPSWDQVAVKLKKFDFLVSDRCDPDHYGFGITNRSSLIEKAENNSKKDLVEQLKKYNTSATNDSRSPQRRLSTGENKVVVVNLNENIGEYSGSAEKVSAFFLACLGQLNNEHDAFYLSLANKVLGILRNYCSKQDKPTINIDNLVTIYEQLKKTNEVNINDALTAAANGDCVAVKAEEQEANRKKWLRSFFGDRNKGLIANNETARNFMSEQKNLIAPT